jgi:hypothetical protein
MRNLWRQFSSVWARSSNPHRRNSRRSLAIETLESRVVLSANNLVISEFLASNQGGFEDEDGQAGDWIEIYNPTSSAINLQNWSLTDSANDLNKWQFPAVTIESNQFLVVFADNKDRLGPVLHTNFNISGEGEYLALVDPNGIVVSEYTPTFPPQIGNVSYGVQFDTTNLITAGAAAQTRIPTSGSLGNTWTQTSFVPTGWTSGTTGVGFGILQPGFNVTYIKANRSIDNLSTAEMILADNSYWSNVNYSTAPTINYMGTGGGGRYSGDIPYPTQTAGSDYDWFLIQATGQITIPTAGNWTFGVNSDDGFSLRLERNGVVFTSSFPGLRGPGDTLATFNIPTAGEWIVTLLTFENGGGSNSEFFAAPGSFASFSAADFDLVGNTATGGLAVNSIPGGSGSVVIGTNVGGAMLNQNASAYIRVPFMVANPAAFDELHLDIRYDDGFVAYLNGTEIARRNAPATLLYNSTATGDRTIAETVTPERINLTGYLNLLQTGNNVLAIQGLNSSASDGSFLILPELTASAIHPDQLRYFAAPSPGDPNSAPSLGIVETVVSNVAAGFYTSTQFVTLSTPTPGSTIRYTIDGSAPTETNGITYTGPIAISTTTPLRARAFKTGYFSLPATAWTYLFLDDVIMQSPSDDVAGGFPDVGAAPPGWPTSWGNNVVDYGMDQTVVNSEGAAQVKSALMSISTMSISTDLANLFNPSTGIYANAGNDGRDWERPASVELINPDGTPGFQIDAGIRIRGGYSRSSDNPKHAFRIFFRSDYGDSTLEYPLFPGQPGAATEFKKFDLRTAQNYSWSFGGDASNTMIQDGFARQSQLDMGELSTHSRWVHLYLNGQYWGIFQIEERPEADYAATYLGGTDDDYDVVKVEAGPYTIYATDGNLNAYQRLWQYATTPGFFASNSNYFRLQGKDANGNDDLSIPDEDVLIDVDNLIVYMLGIFHGGNLDAPISAFLGNTAVNNFFAIRNRTGRDGFIYIQHDAEHTLRNVNENRMGPYNTASFDRFNPQYLHQQLMANAEYRQRFGDLVQQLFIGDGPMSVVNAQARYQADVNALNTAIIAESVRWGDAKRPTSPLTRANWLSAVASQRDGFLVNRNEVLFQQLRNVGLMPPFDAPQYLVNGVAMNSGVITPGDRLRFTASTGLVYYTTDGSDPRLLGGGINPAAQVYDPSAITTTVIAPNSQWRYFDQGVDLGTAWRATGYNDSAWAIGNGEFGYGDGDEATVVSFGPNSSNKYMTTYFRRTFNVADPTSVTGLELRLKRDDGAVIYINGQYAARSNMPAGDYSYSTPASSAVGGTDESTFFTIPLDPSLLVAGVNSIAIEIHQSGASSSDLSFDAELRVVTQSNPGVVLNQATQFTSRILSGGQWSALSKAAFSIGVPATAANLAITEMYYHPDQEPGTPAPPLDDEENYEFIELRNIGTETIDLSNVRFTTGITFNFSDGNVLSLNPGEYVVVVKNITAFEHRFGTNISVAGEFGGNLNNGGEQIILLAADNAVIHDYTYDDVAPWPTSPDGNGPSLTVINVAVNYSSAANWRPSYVVNGTPGADDPPPPSLVSTVINGATPQLLGLPSPFTAQRSMVRSFQLTFDTPVVLATGAVGISVVSGGGAIPGVITVLNATGGTSLDTVWNVTFSGANTHGGSLADGVYNLTLDPLKVTSAAALTMQSAPPAHQFYVLFGDADGNRTVNNLDIINARREANTTSAALDYLWLFDFDWNGTISNTDIINVRRNSGKTM